MAKRKGGSGDTTTETKLPAFQEESLRFGFGEARNQLEQVIGSPGRSAATASTGRRGGRGQGRRVGSVRGRAAVEATPANPLAFLAEEDALVEQQRQGFLDAAGGIQEQSDVLQDQFGLDVGFQDRLRQQGLDAFDRDVTQDQLVQNLANASIRPVQQQFQEQILPGLAGRATAAGAFGGSRDQLLRAQAGRDFIQTAQDTRARVFSDADARNQQQQLSLAGLIQQGGAGLLGRQPGLANAALAASNIRGGVGAARQARSQLEIDQPRLALDRFLQQTGNINAGGTTITGGGGSSGFNAGGALGGAQLGFQVGGPFGAAAGGLAGGFL